MEVWINFRYCGFFFHADALYAYTSPVSVYTCIKTHLKNSFTHYVIYKRELNWHIGISRKYYWIQFRIYINLIIQRNTKYFIPYCHDLLGIVHRLYIHVMEWEMNYRAGTPQMLQTQVLPTEKGCQGNLDPWQPLYQVCTSIHMCTQQTLNEITRSCYWCRFIYWNLILLAN